MRTNDMKPETIEISIVRLTGGVASSSPSSGDVDFACHRLCELELCSGITGKNVLISNGSG